MNEKEFWTQIENDSAIPASVQRRVRAAFDEIKAETATQKVVRMNEIPHHNAPLSHRSRKIFFVGLAAAALTVGSVAAASIVKWSPGTENAFHVTDEQKSAAESSGLTTVPESVSSSVSAVSGEITITAVQTLVDNYNGHVAFRIDGLNLEEHQEPMFEDVAFYAEDDDFSWGGSFASNFISSTDGTGRVIHADGSSIEDGEQPVYQLDDGSYEYMLDFHSADGKPLPGLTVHAKFKNLSVAGKAEISEVTNEGTWDMTWTLTGTSDVREAIPVDQDTALLGDTGASLQNVHISPITLKATLDWPRQIMTEEGMDENGNKTTLETYKEPPYLSGVRLKDGTLLCGITQGGHYGYNSSDEKDTIWTYSFATNVILNPNEIDALLFIKTLPENENIDTPLTEENFYIVPLK